MVVNGHRACFDRIHSYEWRKTQGDVLRPLYEQFVDKSDRNDFGEVYTPDWLAEMMVKEVLDAEWCENAVNTALDDLRNNRPTNGIGVLDPTCGSGTFLYHCVKRILTSKTAIGLHVAQKSDVVCHLVHGIDINPVAVEFSRATILRALPAGPSASDPAVYQGDALMLRQREKNTLFDSRDGEVLITSPEGREIFIPQMLSEHAEFPDMLRRIVDAAASGTDMPVDIGRENGKSRKRCTGMSQGSCGRHKSRRKFRLDLVYHQCIGSGQTFTAQD